MLRLRDTRPEDLLRCGGIFGRLAEQVQDAGVQARQSASVRWTGHPSQRYQAQLAELSDRMRVVQDSHEQACVVLLSCSRALEPVRALALEADLLEAAAQDQARARVLTAVAHVPADPGLEEERLLTRAALLRREAVEREQVASRRCAVRLRELSDDAPHVRGFQANRFASDFGTGLGQGLVGAVVLGADVFRSVPGVGTAESRREARATLWAQAQAMAHPWTAIEQLLDQVRDGHGGVVAGGVAAGLLLKRAGTPGRRLALFGAHDEMHNAVLKALHSFDGDAGLARLEAWALAHEQKLFYEELLRLSQVPLPSLDEMLRDGVDLVHHEACFSRSGWIVTLVAARSTLSTGSPPTVPTSTCGCSRSRPAPAAPR